MRRASLVVSLALLGLVACRRASPTGVQLDASVREPSGLVASRAHPGVFWTHPDSGQDPLLFAIDLQGKVHAKLEVEGVDNVDWEDIALDDRGNLWLGDIGNNFSARQDLVVHRIAEPDPGIGKGTIAVDHSVRFSYPDQERFDQTRSNFDAEALLWWEGTLWISTKHGADTLTVLYRFPSVEADEVVLERISELDLEPELGKGHPASEFPCMATGADVAADQKHWALLSYDAVFVFELPPAGGRDLFGKRVNRIGLNPEYVFQVEAVAWEGEQLILLNEDGAIYRIAEPLTTAAYPE